MTASSILPGVVAMSLTSDGAFQAAQSVADQNGAPVGIWETAYAYYVSEEAPDDLDFRPEDYGYVLMAVVEPSEVSL